MKKDNILICADCNKPMVSYDLHEFKCDKTNITLKMEEKLCLFCTSKTLSIVDTRFGDAQFNIGRTEALDVTLSDDRVSKYLEPEFIYNVVLNHYKNYILNLCVVKTGYVWYDGFEIDLWESITSKSNRLKLTKKQISDMRLYVKSTGYWLTAPGHELDFDSSILPLIKVEEWLEIYKRKQTQKSNEQQRTGRTEKNT
jgi:hypothetical protein